MKEQLFIFDNKDNLLTVTKNYIEAPFKEDVKKPISLTIVFPVDDEDAEYLVGGNQVAFRDLKGNFRLFTIRETDDTDETTTEKIVECLPNFQELSDVIVEEYRPQNQTAEYVLGLILEKSRWKVGNVADLGEFSTSFYYEDAFSSLKKLVDIWGGEIVDRVEIDGNKIAGRYIDIVYQKGENKGKRFEVGKDIQSIQRTVLYYPKTALYGQGASLQTEGGGHSRKVTFRDVMWFEDEGDPTEKPIGQRWVGDEEARLKHGVYDPDTGEMEHRFGTFEDNDEESPEELLRKTWLAVQDEKEPKTQYEMTIATFYGISDYEHEQVFLGDTGVARDLTIKPNIVVQSRVLSWEYDLANPNQGDLVIGNILDLDPDNSDVDWVVDKVKDDSGNWDSGGGPITDDKFPDVKPDVPTNFEAEGLFRTIMLSWDYDSSYVIAHYEIYGSQTKDFVPDDSNLLFRGKVGGYSHQADTDELWYYRLRAVNPHGTASDYTNEINASTVQLNLPDVEDIVPEFLEYQIYQDTEAPDPDEYKYWLDITKEPYILKRWNESKEGWIRLSPTKPEDIGAVDQLVFETTKSELEENILEVEGTAKGIRTEVFEYVETETDELEDQVKTVRENVSEVEQTAESIIETVTSLETDYEEFVESTQSSFEQHADLIESRVTRDYVQAEINKITPENRNIAIGTSEEKEDILIDYDLNMDLLKESREKKITISFDGKLDSSGSQRVVITIDGDILLTHDFDVAIDEWDYYEVTLTLDDFPDDAEEASLNMASMVGLSVSNIRKLKVEAGDEATPWSPAPEEVGDLGARVVEVESIIEQHADEIEISVKENNVVSSINQTAEQIKIDAERVALGDGDLIVQDGKVYIRNGIITNELIAENALIDGAKIADLSVDKLTGNITDFVQSRWNNVTNSVQIDPRGLFTFDGLSTITSLLSGTGHEFYYDSYVVGEIGTSAIDGNPQFRGLTFNLENEAHYMAWTHLDNPNDSSYTVKLGWYSHGTNSIYEGFYMNDNLEIDGMAKIYGNTEIHGTLSIDELSTQGYVGGDRTITLANYTWSGAQGIAFTRGASGASLYLGSNMAVLIDDGNAHIEVGTDGTGNYVLSTDVYNRTYSSTSQQMRVTVNGVFGRSTSSRRYKVAEEDVSLEYARRMLELNAMSWFDKRAVEDYCYTLETGEDTEVQRIERIGGIIAEDVHDAGLEMYVSYDDKGRPDGVHDSLWSLFLPITKDHDIRIYNIEQEHDSRIRKNEKEIKSLKEQLSEEKERNELLSDRVCELERVG